MSMESCEKHGWWEVNGQDACPSCEIARLRAEVERLTEELDGVRAESDGACRQHHITIERLEVLFDQAKSQIKELEEAIESDPWATEVEQVQAKLEPLKYRVACTERERDEALAQVAVLLRFLERVMCAESPEEYLDDLSQLWNVEGWLQTEARALLDRLQRAGVVVEAARLFKQKLAKVEKAINTAFMIQQIHGLPYRGENYGEEITRLRKALAAWEEGKE